MFGQRLSLQQRSLCSCSCRLSRAPTVPMCGRKPFRHTARRWRSASPASLEAARRLGLHLRAINTETENKAQASASSENGAQEELYEVYVDKPIGIKFARGNDGGAYVIKSDASLGNTDERIEAGDKLVQISASFGSDVWEAQNFGQIMYAIKTRNGQLYFKFKKNYGDMSAMQEEGMSDSEKQFRRERAGGNYGAGTKELQAANYRVRKEQEEKRRRMFDEGLEKFQAGDIQGALFNFEEVVSMEPTPVQDLSKARVTQTYRVAHYNIACCYAALKETEPGLEALETAMATGFEQFSKIRSDPNLAPLRASPKFKPLLDKYDEPVLALGAMQGLKGLFSFGKKS